MAVTGVTAASQTTGLANSDASALSANYEMFLTLLTTQLKVQDPLDPMNADEFTQQLVQYSSIEQQIKMNANMEDLIASVESSNAANMVSYIGTEVVADGVQSVLRNGQATWEYEAGKGAEKAEITIRNSGGAIVFSEKIDIAEGEGSYVWNGRTTGGAEAPKGNYSITIKATKESGDAVSVDTKSTGIVEGVDMSGTEPALLIGGSLVPISSVRSVRAPL